MKTTRFFLFLLLPLFSFSQNKLSYQIFDKNGHSTSYKKIIKNALKSDIVLFGEYHNNAISHWLELELTKDLADKNAIILGAEMIEADNQKQLDHFLKGEINQKQLDSTARLWPNYKTDYKPLVDFAKDINIPFVATNIPRRFASLVFKQDFIALEKLSELEKSWIAPLPIAYDPTLSGYAEMLNMDSEHANDKMPKAQAIKDATMAYFILKNRTENSLFLHYNGSYHSNNFQGIYWYLKHDNPALKIVTIATVSQKDISKLEKEYLLTADFIIVIDEDVIKTY